MEDGIETALIQIISGEIVSIVIDGKTQIVEFSGEVPIENALVDLRRLDVGDFCDRESVFDKEHVSEFLSIRIKTMKARIPASILRNIIERTVHGRTTIPQCHEIRPSVFYHSRGMKIPSQGSICDDVFHRTLNIINVLDGIDDLGITWLLGILQLPLCPRGDGCHRPGKYYYDDLSRHFFEL